MIKTGPGLVLFNDDASQLVHLIDAVNSTTFQLRVPELPYHQSQLTYVYCFSTILPVFLLEETVQCNRNSLNYIL